MRDEPFHVLLADDDEGDRLLFKEAFSELKIKTVVHTVNNGFQLMEWLDKKGSPLPHLIFLDLNMPIKNGFECLREIKSKKKLKDVFIAIYSTSDNEKDMEETFLNGANVYIAKPNDFKILKQVLEKAVVTAFTFQDPKLKRENFLLRV
jgi:CheY-like chemotaxis protein